MECKKEENKKDCTCTANCSRRGICCECVANHRAKRQIPGCFFNKEGEAAWDRSYEFFAKLVNEKKI
ncbi:MAG: DUF6485 family protein [Planctomycetia bacterium]|nr:DUF6485 family protein [Planctomycetia bacterium]